MYEKPGQCRCATCGNVFLWREEPKLWELASGQIASPWDSYAPLRQDRYSNKYVPPTYWKSWYYFNGKPLDCSLCTVVACVDCPRVFRWGDQFRREVCPCGGAVEVRRMSNPGPQRPVFVRQFERRCSCCGDVETLGGLEYLSYDDPGQHPIADPNARYWHAATHANFGCLGGHVTFMLKHNMCRDEPYALPDEYANLLRECRGMFSPHPLCMPCQRRKGRAIFCIYTVPNKLEQWSRDKMETEKRHVWEAVSLMRSTFPNASAAWPIDCPAWHFSAEGNRCFTSKWMGHAFFVCSCRGDPRGVSSHFVSTIRTQNFRDAAVFYNCPYLEHPTAEAYAKEEEEADFCEYACYEVGQQDS